MKKFPSHKFLMLEALKIAHLALATKDVPVGAILVDSYGNIVATGCNEREKHQDPTLHAEIVALRSAAQKLKTWRLEELTMVITLEPCIMCAGAIIASRIKKVIFGAWETQNGAAGSIYDILRDPRLKNNIEVYAGIEQKACASLLQQFFTTKRK